jgi:hypothetical protein
MYVGNALNGLSEPLLSKVLRDFVAVEVLLQRAVAGLGK